MQQETLEVQILAIGLALKNISAAMGAEPEDKELWEAAGDSELGPDHKDECVSWIVDLIRISATECGGSK
jgi:hypothetical protein